MARALLITALGGIARTTVDSLRDKQRIVGGLIQPVQIQLAGSMLEMYINEEGKNFDLPQNDLATRLCRPGIDIFAGDYIAGDVFITGPIDDYGNETDIPEAAVLEVLSVFVS